MVRCQIEGRGIRNPDLLAAMRSVPRHLFVPEARRRAAYDDAPVVLGHGQTISQPYMVALMTDLLCLTGCETVLDVGTGSGYQAAILSELASSVISIEFLEALATEARLRLADLGAANVEVRVGDGSLGAPDCAPYDGILVAAGAPSIPPPLVAQLAPGGRLVMPVGSAGVQTLTLVHRHTDGATETTTHGSCVFVPLVGEYGWYP
ncbi:MAG: protein-L-isoaspartate(D-aspartate) O-methyltransferase [Armatimonadetes bacterium]|nr:protein-L-isoaspartate(D-aspartate) O-methyltransferase [Armatimonadota bacterium]